MADVVLIISTKDLKERTQLHTNIDDKLITPSIIVMQDMYIKPLLGSVLFDKILQLIKGRTLSNDYLFLYENYILNVIQWHVIADLTDTLSYQYYNNGVGNIQSDKEQQLDKTNLFALKNKYVNFANNYAEKLKLYLMQNASQKYPEYLAATTGVDSVLPVKETFRLPLFLGEDLRYKKDDYSLRKENEKNIYPTNNFNP